jgi:hypothetical protein
MEKCNMELCFHVGLTKYNRGPKPPEWRIQVMNIWDDRKGKSHWSAADVE